MNLTDPTETHYRDVARKVAHELRRCLGIEFSVFNISDGQLVHESSEQPNGTAAWRVELVKNWANQEAVFLDLPGGSLAMLLIPLAQLGCKGVAALGVFRLGHAAADDDLQQFVNLWHADLEKMKVWCNKQAVWTRESLRRVASLALDKLASDRKVEQLGSEVESLSGRIGEAFEEISLLYEMTENLRGSSSAAELARLVLDWLIEILPAEQAIIDIHPGNKYRTQSDSLFQSFGESHLEEASFRSLIAHLKPDEQDTPLVLNGETTNTASWPFPGIRELILVPLRTDEQNTGWLAALNHAAGGWFGTPQARLLHAAATILGMRVLFEEVAGLREASEAASAAKSVFLANVSHEFRTPLNGIMSFARLLLEESGDRDTQLHDGLQTIDNCAERLFELVEDVVEFSRLEAGSGEVHPVPFRIDEFLLGIASKLQSRAHAKNLRLELIGTSQSREIVLSDPARLQQVLTLLVRNAIKFTESGLIQLGLQFVDVERRRLRIYVKDSGIGISAEKLETIFDPFVQADGSITRSYGGLGLGLAISKRIAHSLGGDLKVESQLGQGSTFMLDLDAGSWDRELDDFEALRPASLRVGPASRRQAAQSC